MGPLDPGCFGCCMFFPLPKFIQRWMGVSFELTNPKKIARWADEHFDGSSPVLISLYALPVGIGVLHQVADERGYRKTRVAKEGGWEGESPIWQFDLENPPNDYPSIGA